MTMAHHFARLMRENGKPLQPVRGDVRSAVGADSAASRASAS